MINFQVYLNEQQKFKAQKYKNYIFEEGIVGYANGVTYTWKYFSNFNKSGTLTIKPLVDGIVFHIFQGVPVISVPSDQNENERIDYLIMYQKSQSYLELLKYVDFDIRG